MSDGPVSFTLEDGVARIGLDDGKANAINARLLSPLEAALDRAEAESAAVVLHGRTGFFSGGLDLKTLPLLELDPLRAVLEQFGRVVLRLFTFKRPVVMAATGHAIAGGTVFLLTADERYAAAGPYRAGLNETVINLTLPRYVVEMARAQLPVQHLRRIVVAGELFGPEDAAKVGLYDAVVPADQLIARATERARALAALPERAYYENKMSLRREALRAGEEALTRELDAFMAFMRSLRAT